VPVARNKAHFSVCQPHNLPRLLTQSGIGSHITTTRPYHITVLTISNILVQELVKISQGDENTLSNRTIEMGKWESRGQQIMRSY